MRTLTKSSRSLLGILIGIVPPKLKEKEASILRQRYGIDSGLGANRPETLQGVAGRLGITRERVRQIQVVALRKLGSPVLDWEPKTTPLCARCGNPCEVTRAGYQPRYCSVACRSEPPITVTCHWCEKPFTKPAHIARGIEQHPGRKHPGRFFCSRSCQGKSLGMGFGFGVHPEHAGRSPGVAALSRAVVEAARSIPTEHLTPEFSAAMAALATYEEDLEKRRTG
jgi:hypothetical protein